MTKRLPLGARLQGSRYVQFGRQTELAVARSSKALQSDLRFEHLEKVEDLLWELAVAARITTDHDVAAAFSTRNSRPVIETVCFIPVHRLSFEKEIQLQDVLFLPATDARVPAADSFREHEGPFKCVAMVNAAGTNYGKMAVRAREKAASVLRLLRTDLIGRSIPSVQLRFRLGTSYTFPGELRGWNSRPDSSYDLVLSTASLSDIAMERYSNLDPESRNTLQIKADIAVRWMERARFTGEPLIEVLYLTFALEALLGDTQAGLKSGLVARRQLMLSHIMTGMIPHPDQTIMLYGEVRSKAVHGETAREISSQEAIAFHHAVKNAFDQYLDLASRENIQTQSNLTTLLDKHDEHETLVEWLELNGGPAWAEYFRSQRRKYHPVTQRSPGQAAGPQSSSFPPTL